MNTFLTDRPALRLILRLNADRLIFVAGLTAALMLGAWLGSLTLPVF